MPELSASRTGYRGTGLGGSTPMEALRRDYRRRGTPEEPSPAEIVAGIHRQIAKMSPRHAAMVAEFERKQEEKARRLLSGDDHENVLRTSRQNRVRKYGKLRARGVSVEAAAREVGVSLSTAGEYGRELRKAAKAGARS